MFFPPVTIKSRVIRSPKMLFQDVGPHVETWRTTLMPGFLPACCEGGGRYVSAITGQEDSYFAGGYYGPLADFDFDKVAASARSFPARTLYILDEEGSDQQFDTRRVSPELADQNERRFRKFAAVTRDANPGVRLAAYNQIVNGDYWIVTTQHEALAAFERWKRGDALDDRAKWVIGKACRWTGSAYVLDDTISGWDGRAEYLRWKQASTDATVGTYANGKPNAAAGVEDAVDALTPSLYDFYAGDDTEGMVAEIIGECRRIAGGRLVLPFLWPRYHDSNAVDGGKLIPLDEWRLHCRRVMRQADGCVLWGVSYDPPDTYRAHAAVLLEEAADAEAA